jgi:hypothetical protein
MLAVLTGDSLLRTLLPAVAHPPPSVGNLMARDSADEHRTYQIETSPPLLVAGLISIGACLSRLRGSRAFAVDAVEVIRRTLVVLFEMDSMNVRDLTSNR